MATPPAPEPVEEVKEVAPQAPEPVAVPTPVVAPAPVPVAVSAPSVTATPSPKLAGRTAVRAGVRYKIPEQAVTMPLTFGSTVVEKVGMQFGSLSLNGEEASWVFLLFTLNSFDRFPERKKRPRNHQSRQLNPQQQHQHQRQSPRLLLSPRPRPHPLPLSQHLPQLPPLAH